MLLDVLYVAIGQPQWLWTGLWLAKKKKEVRIAFDKALIRWVKLNDCGLEVFSLASFQLKKICYYSFSRLKN